MFGRRNSDQVAPPTQRATESDFDLDALPELPDIATSATMPPAPPSERQPDDSSWRTMFLTPVPTSSNLPEPTPFVPDAPLSEPAPAFTSPPAPTPVPTPAPRPRAVAESVIGPDDFFDGNYRSERGVRIQGTARGSIESRQYIYVEDGAQVEASLSAEDITIAGRFTGTIECRQRLEVTGSGHIQGQVKTARLVIQEGGVLDGQIQMRKAEAEDGTPKTEG